MRYCAAKRASALPDKADASVGAPRGAANRIVLRTTGRRHTLEQTLRASMANHDVTQFIEAAERGDPKAAAQLLPLVYHELRRLAAQKLAGESPGHTLQAT